MEFDFSELMDMGHDSGEEVARVREESPAGLGFIKEAQENAERVKKIYIQQADNIRKSKDMPSEILRGAKNGEDIYTLFLKAVECISLQTGDTVFLKECRKAIEKTRTE